MYKLEYKDNIDDTCNKNYLYIKICVIVFCIEILDGHKLKALRFYEFIWTNYLKKMKQLNKKLWQAVWLTSEKMHKQTLQLVYLYTHLPETWNTTYHTENVIVTVFEYVTTFHSMVHWKNENFYCYKNNQLSAYMVVWFSMQYT